MSSTGPVRIGVVGAGIVGLAVARRLARLRPDAHITVLDKERDVAVHQTGHNSGVVHAGLYYAPGSLKAELCTRGRRLLREFCADHGLVYDECGKLVVARDAGELPALREIERRATQNGVPGLRRLSGAQLREVEPEVVGEAALHSPHTAIVDFRAVARAVADDLRQAGHEIRLGFEVTGVRRQVGGGVVVTSGEEALAVDRLVVCAGLQADRVSRLAGDEEGPAIVPFRGEYFRLVPERSSLVRGLVYPVPDPRYPFLGVHFTRRVDGGVDIGPNAVLALAREGYRRRDVRPADVLQTLSWPGMRPLARRHWRTGLGEFRGSLSRRVFLAAAREFVPALTGADVRRAPAGVRAQAVDRDGTLVDDFRVNRLGSVVTVRNAPSPAATSALAIGEYVADRVLAPE
ncbi:L-2-hydroxyglutarate oxidase [Geodermatophilus sabuli]|uniref:L-2-hydroxyglutarate oxidase LhgO n=1 Tax=Geodermatophilus sabuli TaxID=1564158 RepID=A0A285EKS5_9ACTN|nr:L-2-hydroxyglutarate oxidase [Geodermatophilus sabuli]MBB3083953.1 L-2-hydroxyglutarate oxidase LhgO [Geodermatophilus sabuli]SNX98601.1 L-2-hydroxyglutarate oxidase LhgO [Geodermatophilus sabuli]